MRVGFVLRSAEIKPLFFDLFVPRTSALRSSSVDCCCSRTKSIIKNWYRALETAAVLVTKTTSFRVLPPPPFVFSTPWNELTCVHSPHFGVSPPRGGGAQTLRRGGMQIHVAVVWRNNTLNLSRKRSTLGLHSFRVRLPACDEFGHTR